MALLVDAMGPWFLHPGSSIAAGLGGDVSSSIVKFDQLARGGVVPFLPGHLRGVAWPRGLATTPGLDAASFISSCFLWLGSIAFGSVVAHGLEALLGYALTAIVTFAFARRVTGSMAAGVVAGTAYAFFPQMVSVVHAATTYAHMWLFVLPLWALWSFALGPGRRQALVAGLSVVPAVFWTPYYALHATVVLVAGLAMLAALSRRLEIPVRLIAIAGLPVLAAAAGLGAIGVVTKFKDQPNRPLSDMYEQAAHPLMYVSPGTNTTWTHAGAGLAQTVREATIDHIPRAAQTNLYLGVSVMLLAVVGLVAVAIPWLRRSERESDGPAIAVLLGGAAAVACFVCSLPPTVRGVPMPGLLFHQLAPGLRAGQRFVMPLMAGVTVMAAVGFWRLVRGRSALVVGTCAAVAVAVISVDHRTYFADAWVRTPPASPAIERLASAPPGPAVHVQESGYLAGLPQRPCFLQQHHRHPLVNVCGVVPPPEWLWHIGLKPLCPALHYFHARGLRYVIADHMPDDPLPACMRDRSLGPPRLLADDGKVRVWALSQAR